MLATSRIQRGIGEMDDNSIWIAFARGFFENVPR